MNLTTFTDGLRRLSAEDIRRCAAGLDAEGMSVADAMVEWRAELAIDRLLRRQCSRAENQRATAASHSAARCVLDAARRTGIELPDTGVTRVARTAGQIARGLALNGLAGSGRYAQVLLGRWEAALGIRSPLALTAA